MFLFQISHEQSMIHVASGRKIHEDNVSYQFNQIYLTYSEGEEKKGGMGAAGRRLALERCNVWESKTQVRRIKVYSLCHPAAR